VNLNTGWTELSTALKNLRQHWDETREHWDDVVARDFEENRIAVLEEQVLATLKAIDRLAPVLARLRHECG
jgi:hypothetical protein